jgi:CRISPR-associated protein Cmr2
VTLEIRGNEHLSALALVKRLFPLLKPDALTRAIGWVPDHAFDPVTNTGSLYLAEAQKALRNWPSTAFISAIPWIVRVGETNAEASEVFAQNQLEVLDQRAQAERPQYSRIQGIDNILLDVPMFSALDGTLHFSERLDKRQYSEASARLVPILRENISEFHKDLGQEKGRTPTAFYAMLDMDGDHMGHVFSSSLNNARIGSTALLEFAAAVPGIIREHDGVTIYAGADDVNAMLPIDNAIACASAIRKKWQEVFDNLSFNPKLKNPPTLSGSIVFADYQNALDEVRRVAHTRLDQVAKDGCGRNALALAVMKSGGITAEWASQWEADGSSKTDQIMDLAQVFCSGDVAKKFPYKIRSRFTEILEAKVEQDHLFSVAQIGQILLKEFADSGLGDDPEKYKSWTTLMGSVIGPAAGGGSAKRHVGGILIARFLAQNVDWAYLELRWPASSPGPLKTAPQAAPT